MEREIIEKLADMLQGKVDHWEIFYSSQDGISIEARDGAVESLKASSSKGIAIRTLKGFRPGFSFTTDLSDSAAAQTVENAITSSMAVTSDDFYAFPNPADTKSIDLKLYDPSISQTAQSKKIEKALLMEGAAVGFDKRIKRVRNAVYGETTAVYSLVNSKGVNITDRKTFVSASIMAMAEEGEDAQMGWEMDFSHFADDIDVEKVGYGAAKRAVDMLGAKGIGTIKCPVILENSTVAELLEVLAPSFLADNLHKGKSMLKDKKGRKIFSDCVTIVDDGLLCKGWAASLFDGEGAARQRTPLVAKGALENYLYDTYWAKRCGDKSTGNSSRGGFKSAPGISISNLYIENGASSFDELIKEIQRGIFITGLLGVHTVNTVSGDFSLGATGFYIENGKFSYPVRGIAIAGNLMDLFSKAAKAGNDIRFFGNIGAPSLLLEEMDISGAG